MLRFLYIALGGAAGSLIRYWVSGFVQRFFDGGFPWGTLSVNLVGSVIAGFLWGLFESAVVSQNVRLLFFIGILGSFTTFSTFSLESFHLLRDGEYGIFLVNVLSSVIFGIGLVFAGYFAGRYVFNALR